MRGTARRSARVNSFTNRCLDQALDQLGLPSDYALSQRLGITPQAIHKMRGGGAMSSTTAAKLAALLGWDPLKIIAEAQLERGGDPEVWKRLAGKAAALALVAVAAALSWAAWGDLTITELLVAFAPFARPEYTLLLIQAALAGVVVGAAAVHVLRRR